MKIQMLLILLSLLCSQLCSSQSFFDDDTCGDWVAYKDEKCLKLINQNLVDYADAEIICQNEDGALLPSITTEEKQLFLENLIKSENAVDNVWIGLKYVNNSYVWVDGTEVGYIHWTNGSPNDSTFCVQMETEKNVFGYWTDVACTKKNLVICEKLQLWPLSKIQSTLINMQSALADVVRNFFPIGFIYVQLPKEKPPQEIWWGMEWEDVSSEYAGLFFRTEGGNSASFGEIQNESSPRLATVKVYGNFEDVVISVPSDGTESEKVTTGTQSPDGENRGLSFQLSKEEVCPRNTAVRIWKRTL